MTRSHLLFSGKTSKKVILSLICGLFSVIFLFLVYPSFSFLPDDPISDEHVTSVSVSVRRITKTKGNISVRINRKRETLKLKIKRRGKCTELQQSDHKAHKFSASRRLLQNYGPNTLLNNTRLNFGDPEFHELTKNKTNCREPVQEQNRREPFPDFNNRSKAATPEQLGIWDWSQAFASEGNEKLQMEPKQDNQEDRPKARPLKVPLPLPIQGTLQRKTTSRCGN